MHAHFRCFKGQCTKQVLYLIDENNCVIVLVPPNLTHVFQPLDLSINGVAKAFLTNKFSEWYSKEIAKGLDQGQNIYDIEVNTTLTVMKPIHANWIMGLYDRLRNYPDLIKKDFEETGITAAIEQELEPVDSFIQYPLYNP